MAQFSPRFEILLNKNIHAPDFSLFPNEKSISIDAILENNARALRTYQKSSLLSVMRVVKKVFKSDELILNPRVQYLLLLHTSMSIVHPFWPVLNPSNFLHFVCL